MTGGSARLTALKNRTEERSRALWQVKSALSPTLAQAIASAGIEGDILHIGVTGATWASRLRYTTDILRKKVSDSMGVDLKSVRIRVVPPPAPAEPSESPDSSKP